MCLVAQPCPTLCNPMGCSSPGFPFHGKFSDKNPGVWVAISSSRGSSWPRDQTHISSISCIGRWVLNNTAPSGKSTDLILYTLYSTYCIKVYCVLAYMVHYILFTRYCLYDTLYALYHIYCFKAYCMYHSIYAALYTSYSLCWVKVSCIQQYICVIWYTLYVV